MARDDVVNDTFAIGELARLSGQHQKGKKPDGIWTEPEEFGAFMPTRQMMNNTPEVFRHA